MTTAEKIAARLENDGSRWVERVAGARMIGQRGRGRRYVFADGSAIVFSESSGFWGLGVTGASDDCRCWATANGGRHHEDCADLRP